MWPWPCPVPLQNARSTDQIEYLQSSVGIAWIPARAARSVLRSADQKSIASWVRNCVTGRGYTPGQALPDELDGGTFSITNLGMYE
jgi:hypothetical protein